MADEAKKLASIQESILKGVDTEALKEALAARGEIVEIATKHGPDESWFYGSDGLGRCLSCKFFALSSSYKSGRGTCRIRSVPNDDFPKRAAGNWCGEHQPRLATQGRFHEPPVEGEQSPTPSLLLALDNARQHMLAFVEASEKSGRAEYPIRSAKNLLRLIDRAQRLGFNSDEDRAAFEEALGEPLPSCLGQAILEEIDRR